MKLFFDRPDVEQRVVVVVILAWILLDTMIYFDLLGFYPDKNASPSLLMNAWSFVNFPGIHAFTFRSGHIGECVTLGSGLDLSASMDCSSFKKGYFVEFDLIGYIWFVIWPVMILLGLYGGSLWALSAGASRK